MDEEEEKINLFALSSSEEEDFIDDSAICLSEIPTASRSSTEREQCSHVTDSDPATDGEDSQTGRTFHTEEFGSSFHDETEKSYDLNCEEEESTITSPNRHPTPSEDGNDTHGLQEVNIEELDLNTQEAEQPDESQRTTQLISSDDNTNKQEKDNLELDLNSKEEDVGATGVEEPDGNQHTTQLMSVDNGHPAQNLQEIKTVELDLHSKDKVSSTTYPKQPVVIQQIAQLISSMKYKQPQSPQERKIYKLTEKLYRDSLKIVFPESESASSVKKDIRQVNYLLPLQVKGINLSGIDKSRIKKQLKKVYKTFEDAWIEKTTPKLTETAEATKVVKNPPKISQTKQKSVPANQVNKKRASIKSRADRRREFQSRQQALHTGKKPPTPATITRPPVLYGKQDHSQNKNLQSYPSPREIKNLEEKSKRTYSPHEIDTFRKSFFPSPPKLTSVANDTGRVNKRFAGEETTYDRTVQLRPIVAAARHTSERRRRSPDEEEPRRTRSGHEEKSYSLPPNVTSSDLNRMPTYAYKSIQSARDASYEYRETFSRTPSAFLSDDVNASHTREKRSWDSWAETLDTHSRGDIEDFFSSPPAPKIRRGSVSKDRETRRLDEQSDNFERQSLQTQDTWSNDDDLRTYPPSGSPSRSASDINMSGAMRRKIIKEQKRAEGTWLGRNAYQAQNNYFKSS